MTTFIAQNSKGDTFCVKVDPDHHVDVTDMVFDHGYKIRICDKYHFVKMAEEGRAKTVQTAQEVVELGVWIKDRRFGKT